MKVIDAGNSDIYDVAEWLGININELKEELKNYDDLYSYILGYFQGDEDYIKMDGQYCYFNDWINKDIIMVINCDAYEVESYIELFEDGEGFIEVESEDDCELEDVCIFYRGGSGYIYSIYKYIGV